MKGTAYPKSDLSARVGSVATKVGEFRVSREVLDRINLQVGDRRRASPCHFADLPGFRAGMFSGEVTLRDASLVRGVHFFGASVLAWT